MGLRQELLVEMGGDFVGKSILFSHEDIHWRDHAYPRINERRVEK